MELGGAIFLLVSIIAYAIPLVWLLNSFTKDLEDTKDTKDTKK